MFIKKSLLKIGIPTLIFSIIYILYRLPLCFIGECSGLEEVIVLFKDILKGSPFYHMWYMYMIIGVYCLAPIVIEF